MVDARAIAARAMMNTNEIVDRVRAKIVQRGGSSGIKGLAKLLAIMDDNGDKKLSKEELKYVMFMLRYAAFALCVCLVFY